MTSRLWGRLRDARYALPRLAGWLMTPPDVRGAARICARLHGMGLATCAGYFQADTDSAEAIVAANTAVAELLGGASGDTYLSVKAPPLAFDRAHLNTIAEAAAAAGMSLMFDAHAPGHADATLDAVASLLPHFAGTGCVLPARWRRSMEDAERFRDTSAPIRVVKGEWADPAWEDPDVAANYLAIVAGLAGRRARVAVATHQPWLELLRGLPGRRTRAVARRLGVPVRVYVPFGPGWWPYAIDKALARPYLPVWAVKDALGIGSD
jgi:proline dehydrogenase